MRRNTVTRKGKFDAGHRVMNERFKCFNLHGHEYHYELTFSFRSMEDIGYAIDFKEIKRVACEWIDETFDHGFIANPKDHIMIDACLEIKSKLYLMNLAGEGKYCNPTAENIAKELFYAVSQLLDQKTPGDQEDYNLKLEKIKLFETMNCYVECDGLSGGEFSMLNSSDLGLKIDHYKNEKGIVEYDDRKAKEVDSNQ